MLDDSVIIGLIVILICGAASFYLYMRIAFIERKMSMMEAVLMDIKMAMDAIMSHNHASPSPIPISPTPPSAPLVEAEPIPEEGFYSAVLEQAHEESMEVVSESLDQANSVTETVDPDLDSMSKNDLLLQVEKLGLRAKKSSSRNEIIALLRRSTPLQNDAMKAGAENVSGSTGTTSSLDGSVNVDLGQGAKLE